MGFRLLLASLGPLTIGHHVSEHDHAPSGRTAQGPTSHRLHSPTACSHLHAPSQPTDHATLDQLYQPHVVFPSGQNMSFSVIAEALHLRHDVTRDFSSAASTTAMQHVRYLSVQGVHV